MAVCEIEHMLLSCYCTSTRERENLEYVFRVAEIQQNTNRANEIRSKRIGKKALNSILKSDFKVFRRLITLHFYAFLWIRWAIWRATFHIPNRCSVCLSSVFKSFIFYISFDYFIVFFVGKTVKNNCFIHKIVRSEYHH